MSQTNKMADEINILEKIIIIRSHNSSFHLTSLFSLSHPLAIILTSLKTFERQPARPQAVLFSTEAELMVSCSAGLMVSPEDVERTFFHGGWVTKVKTKMIRTRWPQLVHTQLNHSIRMFYGDNWHKSVNKNCIFGNPLLKCALFFVERHASRVDSQFSGTMLYLRTVVFNGRR